MHFQHYPQPCLAVISNPYSNLKSLIFYIYSFLIPICRTYRKPQRLCKIKLVLVNHKTLIFYQDVLLPFCESSPTSYPCIVTQIQYMDGTGLDSKCMEKAGSATMLNLNL